MKPGDATGLGCLKECAVIIGSIVIEGDSSPSEQTLAVVARPLLDILEAHSRLADDSGLPLLMATARALRTVFRFQSSPRNVPFEPKYLLMLCKVIQREAHSSNLHRQNICQSATSILANCCDSDAKQKALFTESNAKLLLVLLESLVPRNLEAGLDLLASLCRENGPISAHMAEQKRTAEARLQCSSL